MAEIDDFSKWISSKLSDLRIDDSDSVYGHYIKGILDSDESYDEKVEAIDGLLSGVCDPETNDLTRICREVLDKWYKLLKEKPSGILEDAVIDSKLSQLLESQTLTTTKLREQSTEQRKMKQAILNQYSHMTDDDDEDESGETSEAQAQEIRIQKNTNAQVVAQAEKDKRVQAKLESQKKKDKDKDDREKQKQTKEERKEKVKRKTQKCERRR